YVVNVPPLRQRREDVPLLVLYFLRLFAEQLEREPSEISAEALMLLQQHSFPGNVRELKNILERALILANAGRIDARHVALAIGRQQPSGPASATASGAAGEEENMRLDEVQKQLIQRALERAQRNVSAAAKLLGAHRSFFYRRKLV